MNSYLIKVTDALGDRSRSIRLSMDAGSDQRERVGRRLADDMNDNSLIEEFIVGEIRGTRELIAQYTSKKA